jgi:hypothetical protein
MGFICRVDEARLAVNDLLTLDFHKRRCEKVPVRPTNPDHEILSQRGIARIVVWPRTRHNEAKHAVFILDADDRDVRLVASRRTGRRGALSAASLKRKTPAGWPGFRFVPVV